MSLILRQVVTAIALHTRPDRDIIVKRRFLGTALDPSCESPDGFTTKVGIDATLPLNRTRPVNRNRVPQQMLDSHRPLRTTAGTLAPVPGAKSNTGIAYEIFRDRCLDRRRRRRSNSFPPSAPMRTARARCWRSKDVLGFLEFAAPEQHRTRWEDYWTIRTVGPEGSFFNPPELGLS